METEMFIKRLAELQKEAEAMYKDEDFVVNKVQMRKYMKLCKFFEKVAEENDDWVVKRPKLSPHKNVNGGLTVSFILLDLYCDYLDDFREVMQYISAVTIEADIAGNAVLSITVPDIFVLKEDLL